MKNEDLKRWDEEAGVWDKELKSDQRIGKTIIRYGFEQMLGDISGKQYLDAGCGNGILSELLNSKGAVVLGVDGSSKMVEIARRNHPRIKFEVVDLLQKLNFETGSFDGIICSNVIMSLSEMDGFLKECFRVLKNPGVFIICVFHPAFNEPTMKLHRSWFDKLIGNPVVGVAYNYFQKTKKRKDEYGTKPWPFYHRVLSEYFDAFRNSGFIVDKILEPNKVPDKLAIEKPDFYATRLPRFIFFKLIKP